ncbi:hypothetical protein BsWGS_05862 [Bradybaena similaris]
MMTGSAIVIHLVAAIVLALSAEGSDVWQTETSVESLHPSSHVPFEKFVTPATAEVFHSRNTEHTTLDILATSRDTKPILTLAPSIAASPTSTGIASTPASGPIATSEGFQSPAKTPTAQSSFAETTHAVNATHLYPIAETSIQRAESVLHSLDVAHSQSLENSVWFTVSSEPEVGSTLLHSYGTIFESTATLAWNHSTPLEDQSSTKAGHITPSQSAGSTTAYTTHSTPPPKSVTDKPPSSSTSSKPAIPATKTPVQSSAEELTSGAKIAIGVIVTLCILGAIVAAVVLYRRFNITHRSLKSFLTNGVRYKTYKNATYKDDEGMLIMPDRR